MVSEKLCVVSLWAAGAILHWTISVLPPTPLHLPPYPGDRHLAKKHWKYQAPKKFFLQVILEFGGGGRHLLTAPPPPPPGDCCALGGWGLQGVEGGTMFCSFCIPQDIGQMNADLVSLLPFVGILVSFYTW